MVSHVHLKNIFFMIVIIIIAIIKSHGECKLQAIMKINYFDLWLCDMLFCDNTTSPLFVCLLFFATESREGWLFCWGVEYSMCSCNWWSWRSYSLAAYLMVWSNSQSYVRGGYSRKLAGNWKHQSWGSKRGFDWMHWRSITSHSQMHGNPEEKGKSLMQCMRSYCYTIESLLNFSQLLLNTVLMAQDIDNSLKMAVSRISFQH